MTEYILIPQTTLDAYNLSVEHTLTKEEIVKLKVHKDLIRKFIEQKAVSIQFEIGVGGWKERETLGLELVQQLGQIAKEVGEVDKVYEQFLKEEQEKEEENKNKK